MNNRQSDTNGHIQKLLDDLNKTINKAQFYAAYRVCNELVTVYSTLHDKINEKEYYDKLKTECIDIDNSLKSNKIFHNPKEIASLAKKYQTNYPHLAAALYLRAGRAVMENLEKNINTKENDITIAKENFLLAVQYYEQLENQNEMLAMCYNELARVDNKIEYWRKAQIYNNKIPNLKSACFCASRVADLSNSIEDRLAVALLSEELNDYNNAASHFRLLSLQLMKENLDNNPTKISDAKIYFKKAIDYYEKSGNFKSINSTYKEVIAETSDPTEINKLHQEAAKLLLRLNAPTFAASHFLSIAKYAGIKKQPIDELLNLENSAIASQHAGLYAQAAVSYLDCYKISNEISHLEAAELNAAINFEMTNKTKEADTLCKKIADIKHKRDSKKIKPPLTPPRETSQASHSGTSTPATIPKSVLATDTVKTEKQKKHPSTKSSESAHVNHSVYGKYSTSSHGKQTHKEDRYKERSHHPYRRHS